MLIMSISTISSHFSTVGRRSKSQLHMVGAFINFNDCLVLLIFIHWEKSLQYTRKFSYFNQLHDHIFKYHCITRGDSGTARSKQSVDPD